MCLNRSTPTGSNRRSWRRKLNFRAKMLLAAMLLALLAPLSTGCDEWERVLKTASSAASGDLSPWEFFCLVNAEPGQDTADCLNGLP